MNKEFGEALTSIEKPLTKGFIRLSILLILEKTSQYGYRIYKVIKDRLYDKLSLSTFYTILRELEEYRIVKRIGDKYVLTENGLEILGYVKKKYREIAVFLEKHLA